MNGCTSNSTAAIRLSARDDIRVSTVRAFVNPFVMISQVAFIFATAARLNIGGERQPSQMELHLVGSETTFGVPSK